MNKIKINKDTKYFLFIMIKKGNNKTNSISKIKNTKVKIKKRIEKVGIIIFCGKKPHSKGDIKLTLKIVFFEIKNPTKNKIILKIKAKLIIYSKIIKHL